MLKKKYPSKPFKKLKAKYVHPNQIIKNRMEEEGKYNKAIYEMIENPNHLHLEYVSIYKPKFRPLKGIYDKNQLLFAHDLNLFRKSFYNFEKKNSKVKTILEKSEDKNNENNFIEKYKIFKLKADNKYFNDKKLLKELRESIEKHNIIVPELDENKNLFGNNLLLVKEDNINKFFSYNMGTQKGDSKAFNYMSKLNKILSSNKKRNQGGFNLYEDEQGIKFNNSLFNDFSISNDQLFRNKKDISKIEESETIKDININETLKNLKEIDDFIKLDNKEYFELLNNKKSRKIFINKNLNNNYKGEFHKSIFNLPKTTMNKSSQSINEEENYKNYDRKKVNKSLTILNKDMNLVYRNFDASKKLLSFFNNKSDNLNICNKKIISKNISDYNSMNNKNLIKIKKIYLNRKNSQKSINTIDSGTSTICPNTSYGKFFQARKKNTKPKTLKFTSRSRSILSSKSDYDAEIIYEKIRKSEDSLKHNDMIKRYLKKKKSGENIFDFSLFDVFNNYYKMQKAVYGEDFIDQNIRLKRDTMMKLESIDKFKKYSNNTNMQIENIKFKIEKMMNKISFPFKED